MNGKNDETGNPDRSEGKARPLIYGDLLQSIETLGECPRHVFSRLSEGMKIKKGVNNVNI